MKYVLTVETKTGVVRIAGAPLKEADVVFESDERREVEYVQQQIAERSRDGDCWIVRGYWTGCAQDVGSMRHRCKVLAQHRASELAALVDKGIV